MTTDTQHHLSFLGEELKAQTEKFRQKLNTSAFQLLENNELFVGQFIKEKDGEVILRFNNRRGLPRKKDFYYGILLPESERLYNNYRHWGDLSWGQLIEKKVNFTEATCTWQSGTDESEFSIASLRRVAVEFLEALVPGAIVILGPQKPPLEYLKNLYQFVSLSDQLTPHAKTLLNVNSEKKDWRPFLLDNSGPVIEKILDQLKLSDRVTIQGPPGTGKTYLIAEICQRLISEEKSVLVTALTNKALMELANKRPLKDLLSAGKLHKSNLSSDEEKESPKLNSLTNLVSLPGNLCLATFYVSSELAATVNPPTFDYVIIDEASQAFLSMLAATTFIGKKVIMIGDVKQLPPVATINEDVVAREGYENFVEGLITISNHVAMPSFKLTKTRRLPKRAANYTALFYDNDLESIAEQDKMNGFQYNDPKLGFLHPEGGPTLLKVPMEKGYKVPENAIFFLVNLVKLFLEEDKKQSISVLSFYVDTVKVLQNVIANSLGERNNLQVETVSRVQGMTCDVCIYFVPDYGYSRSLEARLFNVATSRARKHTLIITSDDFNYFDQLDNDVKKYLRKLDLDSFRKLGRV